MKMRVIARRGRADRVRQLYPTPLLVPPPRFATEIQFARSAVHVSSLKRVARRAKVSLRHRVYLHEALNCYSREQANARVSIDYLLNSSNFVGARRSNFSINPSIRGNKKSNETDKETKKGRKKVKLRKSQAISARKLAKYTRVAENLTPRNKRTC